jgi:hypothetical protein
MDFGRNALKDSNYAQAALTIPSSAIIGGEWAGNRLSENSREQMDENQGESDHQE